MKFHEVGCRTVFQQSQQGARGVMATRLTTNQEICGFDPHRALSFFVFFEGDIYYLEHEVSKKHVFEAYY